MVEDSSSAAMIRMYENVSCLKFGINSLNEARIKNHINTCLAGLRSAFAV